MSNNDGTANVLHPIVADEYSESHNFTVTDNGMLTIRDIASMENGSDENPAEFVRMDLHSMRVLYRFLDDPKVQKLIHQW